MQNEVLGSQDVSQEDVSEIREQLRSDGGHLVQGRRQDLKEGGKKKKKRSNESLRQPLQWKTFTALF